MDIPLDSLCTSVYQTGSAPDPVLFHQRWAEVIQQAAMTEDEP